MRVCVYVNKSGGTPWASVTVPVVAGYCLRHGYSLVVRDMPYAEALVNQLELVELLERHDLLWTIDADCLLTNVEQRIEAVPGLGEHVTVCEEGMPWLSWNRINCGSMVYRRTEPTREFLRAVRDAEPEWLDTARYPFVSQSWIAAHAERFAGTLTVVPPGTFNSVAWTQDGGGTTWRPGHLVFHPCCHPPEARAAVLAAKLAEVQS